MEKKKGKKPKRRTLIFLSACLGIGKTCAQYSIKEVENTESNNKSSNSGNVEIIVNHEFIGAKSLTEVIVPVIIDDICRKLKDGCTIDTTDATI